MRIYLQVDSLNFSGDSIIEHEQYVIIEDLLNYESIVKLINNNNNKTQLKFV